MKKIIYTQRVEVIESYQERRDCADQRIADFLWTCGYLPIPVPNDVRIVIQLVDEINPDGIVLTGGNSLVKYGGNAPERDAMDEALIKLAIDRNIPVYGFCRGMQSVLDYFGNKLENVTGHVAVRHKLIQEDEGTYEVNSYHNQACIALKEGCGLHVIAKTQDDVIEAIQHEVYPIIATMWHPEREHEYDINDIARIKELFK